MSVVKPKAPAKEPKRKAARKPPAERLSQFVCPTCERDILVGYCAGVVTRLEPEFTTAASEPVIWSLGQPTYEVLRDGEKAVLRLRVPSQVPEPAAEIAVAHVCDTSRIWMARTLPCPPWFGIQTYIVAQFDGSFRVMRAEMHGAAYKEVLTCSTEESAQEAAYRLNWRDRARELQ